MKKAIAILLALCLCIGMFACGSSEEKESTPTTEPAQYEDTLIEQLKIGDPLSKAEEVFGAPTSSTSKYMNPPKKMKYTYSNVTIYGLEFEPYVVTDESDNVLLYGYFYGSKVHSAAYDKAFDSLKDNFTELYGDAAEIEDRRSSWDFDDGTNLLVSNMSVMVDDFWLTIEYRKPNN